VEEPEMLEVIANAPFARTRAVIIRRAEALHDATIAFMLRLFNFIVFIPRIPLDISALLEVVAKKKPRLVCSA
jgi:hypothetical protein